MNCVLPLRLKTYQRLSGPALGGWGPPPSLDVRAPNIQYTAFNTLYSIYVNKISPFQINAYESIFCSINTTYKADIVKHLLCFKLRKLLLPSFQKYKFFCQLRYI